MVRISADIRAVFTALAVIIYFLSNHPIHNVVATTEQPHGTMPMEQITQTSGKMNQVLHDNRMMIEVNGYKISEKINNSLIHDSAENKFLLVDLSIRSIGHTLKLSPNLFLLNTDSGQIMPSTLTTQVEAGLRPIYLGNGQAIRALLIFERPSFGDITPSLEYSDGSSFFNIDLVPTNPPQLPILGAAEPHYKTGEIMQDHFLKLSANVSRTEGIAKSLTRADTDAIKISLLIQNIGNSTIRIDPSYVFILDNKSYIYGVSESATMNKLLYPLRTVDLVPGGLTSGDVLVKVPKDSANLMFMYSGPNDSFLSRTK